MTGGRGGWLSLDNILLNSTASHMNAVTKGGLTPFRVTKQTSVRQARAGQDESPTRGASVGVITPWTGMWLSILEWSYLDLEYGDL
ncbi:hypothetical protein RRG08_052817 [Elysia crispata]|uniref:Uncharacterized protein n=1 Tax=Elysia crispata TaxID=231223 RepID=A0AAE1B6Q1_9GAST|nr:hypothetical protein RRG08_052817 [Elysia crispata]